ncbi:hypothetical protein BHE74_00057172 [Ensete ventricosum]|nr:hypothetical protein BHE74_00057172 [Ensete ventricosum]
MSCANPGRWEPDVTEITLMMCEGLGGGVPIYLRRNIWLASEALGRMGSRHLLGRARMVCQFGDHPPDPMPCRVASSLSSVASYDSKRLEFAICRFGAELCHL